MTQMFKYTGAQDIVKEIDLAILFKMHTTRLVAFYKVIANMKMKEICELFVCSCSELQIEVAERLASEFKLTKDKFDVESILLRVCKKGCTKRANCLVSSLGLGADDVSDSIKIVLFRSYESNHINLSNWLISEFKLSDDTVRSVRSFLSGDVAS